MAGVNYQTNIDDLARRDVSAIDGWDLAEVKDDVVEAVAEGVRDRTVGRKLDATGGPLKANEVRYADRKRRTHGATQPLVRTGQLASAESLRGESSVERDKITIVYGTGAPDEDGVTDREKAGWNSGERPFFALDDQIVDELIMPIVAESMEEMLRDA